LGGYVSFSFPLWTPSLTTGSYSGSNTLIQSGASFLVKAGASDGSITLTESAKAASSTANGFRPSSNYKILAANLYKVDAAGSLQVDANNTFFDNAYSNGIDLYDAPKITNAGENFAIRRDGNNLYQELRQEVIENDTTYFNMWNMRQSQQYKLELVPTELNVPGLSAWLVDNHLGTTTALNLAETNNYTFNIDGSAAAAADRFKIVYRQVPLSPVPVTFISVSANKMGAAVKVEWKVAGERNIQKYEIERSADGNVFGKVGTVSATGGNVSADITYNWLDATPLSGANFYRVKCTGTSGEVKYSYIVKVLSGGVKPVFTIAPNPVENSVVNVQFKNQQEGRYTLRLLSTNGELIFTTVAEHAGGNSNQQLNLPASVARGAYQLEIVSPDKTREVQNLFINTLK
jgi:Secretion system C-terminal sorting domain